MQCIPSLIYSWLSAITAIVELHNVPRSALSRVIKEFITRDKVPRNTSWENGKVFTIFLCIALVYSLH